MKKRLTEIKPIKLAASENLLQETWLLGLLLLPSFRGRSELVHKSSSINPLQDAFLVVVSGNQTKYLITIYVMLIADYSSAAISIFSGSMKLLSSSVCDVRCSIFPEDRKSVV